jgi:hypothetical protein
MSQNKHDKRKHWKQHAQAVVKKHYILLVLLCLVSVFYGTEYSYVQEHSQTTFDVISGKEVMGPGTSVTIEGKSILEFVEEKLGVDIPALRAQKEKQIEMAEKTDSSISDKLTEIKGERAIDAMADVLEPLSLIFADAEIQRSIKSEEPKLLLIKKILKAHKREAIQIMAILDGEKPETYDINLLKIPMKMLEIVNDPEIQSLFTYQGQNKE